MRSLVLVSALLAAAAALDTFASFSDNIGRNKMLPLSAAAYSHSPQGCLTHALNGAQLKRQLEIQCDKNSKEDTCSGFTAVSHADQAIIISYRGSQGTLQLLAEADESVLESKENFVAGGKVSKYFLDAFTGLWQNGMKDDFLSLKQAYPNYQLWITGHSLGGSMASVAASYIIQLNLFPADQVRLVTFGQPRTGDTAYASAHDRMVPFAYRVTHSHDLVPHIPPEGLEGYHHHKTEIFYDNGMAPGATFKTCQGDEDKKCSNSGLDLSIKDHLHYYDRMVSEWGEAGCV